jgi:hypothetical protein
MPICHDNGLAIRSEFQSDWIIDARTLRSHEGHIATSRPISKAENFVSATIRNIGFITFG